MQSSLPLTHLAVDLDLRLNLRDLRDFDLQKWGS